jgi:proteasome accessory factor A
VGAETLIDPAAAELAMTAPPDGTRAYFRGRCLDRWPNRVVAANWDSMVFDVGEETLRRVPMMEPTRGSRAHVATLIDDCDDITDLLDRLSGRSD